jgi:hypothetical protein
MMKWGAVTLGLCLASLPISLRFLCILFVNVVAFVAMMVVKSRGGR